MFGDNEKSEEERKFEELVEKALAEGRIPIECIKVIEINEMYSVKTVQYIEC